MSKVPMNSFMEFCRVERPRIKAAHPDFTLAEISRELGERYAALSPEERAHFKALSSSNVGAASGSGQAIDWLDHVKVTLSEAAFDELLAVLAQFKSKAIDVRTVTVRVCLLLQGHRDLILGFNAFLPADFKVDASMLDDRDRLDPAKLPPSMRRRSRDHSRGALDDTASPDPALEAAAREVDAVIGAVAAVADDAAAPAASPAAASSSSPASVEASKNTSPKRRARPRSVELGKARPVSAAEQAAAFVAQAKALFDVHKFQIFVTMLQSVVDKERSVRDFVDKASTLFAQSPHLANELLLFLPTHVDLLLRAATAAPASPVAAPSAARFSQSQTLRVADVPGSHVAARTERERPQSHTFRTTRSQSPDIEGSSSGGSGVRARASPPPQQQSPQHHHHHHHHKTSSTPHRRDSSGVKESTPERSTTPKKEKDRK